MGCTDSNSAERELREQQALAETEDLVAEINAKPEVERTLLEKYFVLFYEQWMKENDALAYCEQYNQTGKMTLMLDVIVAFMNEYSVIRNSNESLKQNPFHGYDKRMKMILRRAYNKAKMLIKMNVTETEKFLMFTKLVFIDNELDPNYSQ